MIVFLTRFRSGRFCDRLHRFHGRLLRKLKLVMFGGSLSSFALEKCVPDG